MTGSSIDEKLLKFPNIYDRLRRPGTHFYFIIVFMYIFNLAAPLNAMAIIEAMKSLIKVIIE